MLSRRDLLMSVPAAAHLRPSAAPAARELSSNDLGPISSALRDLHHLTASGEVDLIKERQRTHFKINQKFPAYIDIGLMVWERLSTWHLENHLPLTARRTPEGRMEMEFMFTTLVLKWELADTMISVPYD
jgi:hypothetical protein